MSRCVNFMVGASSLALCALAASASAQTAGPVSGRPAATDATGTQVEEIVVTAQRREERLQTVPVAVSAITGVSATKQGITDTTDLTASIPALNFAQQANGATAFIRGVGSTFTLAGAEPSVAIYVDGVYLPSPSASLFSFNNIQRIEVLRGPQGTLFGRNATGGVIQVVTKDPSAVTSADLSVGYANYDTTTLNFYGTTGITDKLSADVAIYGSNQAAGWGRNLTTGEAIYLGRDFSIRSKVLWKPTDTTTVRLSADYNSSRTQFGFGLKPAPGRTTLDGAGYPGFYNVRNNAKDRSIVHQGNIALTVTQDVGFATLTSITSHQSIRPYYYVDEDGSALPLVNGFIAEPDQATTQELQIASPAASTIKWIGGFFYFHDNAGSAPLNIQGLAVGGATLLTNSKQETDSYAVYGQTTIEVLPKTHFTGGVRYTDDNRSITGNSSLTGLGVYEMVNQSKEFSKITWRLSLDHQFTDDILGYASYNRGFKSGFFNTTVLADPVIRPEVIDAYEAGLKSEYFNHSLRLNLAGYYYDYTNLQVNNTIAGATRILNAASAEIYGLEGDVVYIPIRNLTLTGGFSLTHGRYTDFPAAPSYPPNPTGFGNLSTTVDASGFDTQFTPPFQINFGVDYVKPTAIGEFDAAALYSYNDGFYWDPANELRQPSYSMVNASLGWEHPSKRYGVRLWAKNLANARYYLYGTNTPLLTGFSPAAPLTFGFTVSAHY